MLPPLVQTLVPGNLVIERTETIRPAGPGNYDGTVDVHVPGRAGARGRPMQLRDTRRRQ